MVQVTLPDGRRVEGTQVDIEDSKEFWNEYELSDGTLIRFKAIVTEIYRLDIIDESTGKPNFLVKSNTVMSVKLSEER